MRQTRHSWRGLGVPALALAFAPVLAALPALAQSSSASYVLQQSTIDAAGETGSSTSFKLMTSLGQELAVQIGQLLLDPGEDLFLALLPCVQPHVDTLLPERC